MLSQSWKLMRKIGASHWLTTCNMESYLLTYNIKKRWNVELLVLSISKIHFTGAHLMGSFFVVSITRKHQELYRRLILELVVHTNSEQSCNFILKEWDIIGQQWWKIAWNMQKDVKLVSFMLTTSINHLSLYIQLSRLGHLMLGD